MGLTVSIGIDTTQARLEMSSRISTINLRQKQPLIQMHTEQPRILIDQSEAFASAGLKSTMQMLRDTAVEARQHLLEYIGQTAKDGDRLARIDLKANPIKEFARRDAFKQHEFGIDFIPKTGPEISVKEGKVELTANDDPYYGVQMQYVPGYLNVNYVPYSINMYVKSNGNQNAGTVGNIVDTSV